MLVFEKTQFIPSIKSWDRSQLAFHKQAKRKKMKRVLGQDPIQEVKLQVNGREWVIEKLFMDFTNKTSEKLRVSCNELHKSHQVVDPSIPTRFYGERVSLSNQGWKPWSPKHLLAKHKRGKKFNFACKNRLGYPVGMLSKQDLHFH